MNTGPDEKPLPTLEQGRWMLIAKHLRRAGGNVEAAAQSLRVSAMTVYRELAKWNAHPTDFANKL